MKPTAYLINTARGPIVQEDALIRALEEDWIAGAGLDVFEQEPLPAGSRFARTRERDPSPHGLAWTEEIVRDNGMEACRQYPDDGPRGNPFDHCEQRSYSSGLAFRKSLLVIGG